MPKKESKRMIASLLKNTGIQLNEIRKQVYGMEKNNLSEDEHGNKHKY